MSEMVVGVIGGSGLYEMEGLTDVKEELVTTPFGDPSDLYITGTLNGVKMVFLPRHGRGHRFLPSEVNYRANVYGMKKLGVGQIISVSAVGSLKEEIVPGHIVIPDQFIDRTKGVRKDTFFGNGVVAHVGFADPVCVSLSDTLESAAKSAGATVHRGGTYVCMEGPAFSTRAESRLYKSWGADVIGMTALPEAKLAREAEICYAIIGCVTDYDSWWERTEPVTVEVILDILRKNVDLSRRIIRLAVKRIPDTRACECATALRNAIVTAPESIAAEQKKRLDLLIGKYLTKGT